MSELKKKIAKAIADLTEESKCNNREELEQIFNEGLKFYNESNFIEARDAFTRVLDLDQKFSMAYFNRGLSLYRMDDYFNCLEDIHKYIELAPNDAGGHYTLGLIYEYMDDYLQAIREYTRSYGIDPKYRSDIQFRIDVVARKFKASNSKDNSNTGSSGFRSGKGLSAEEKEALYDFSVYDPALGLTWQDHGGTCKAKQTLQKYQRLFVNRAKAKRVGVKIYRGILLEGPPGCGKTFLAKIFAHECKATFFNVRLTDFQSVWYSFSEKNILKLFDEAASHEASVIFMDELDAFASQRSDEPGSFKGPERELSTFLTCMDGLDQKYNNVMVLGSTNMREKIDTAVISRFDKIITVDKPLFDAREAIFKVHIVKQIESSDELLFQKSLFADNILYSKLAGCSVGLVGRDIEKIVEETARNKFLQNLDNTELSVIDTNELVKAIEQFKEDKKIDVDELD